MKEILNLASPEAFVPIHGESEFLRAHAELARDARIRNVHVAYNGDVVGAWERRAASAMDVSTAQMPTL